jgi:hypothetical protein
MKKITLIAALCLFFSGFLFSQSIKDAVGYYDKDGVHYVTLLTDNSIWRYSENGGWKKVPTKGLPDTPIKTLDKWIKYGMSKNDVHLLCQLDNNTVWKYNEGASWINVTSKDLPSGATIKTMVPYLQIHGASSSETRYVAQLSDNSLGYYSDEDKWKNIPLKGIKDPANMRFLLTSLKFGMMGSATPIYMAAMDDNTLWSSSDGDKWQSVSTGGLPSGATINQIDYYAKLALIAMGTPESRIICCMSDQSLWKFTMGNRNWYPLDNKGLPSGYKIKVFKNCSKIYDAGVTMRILAALEDNTIWAYNEDNAWKPVPMNGLPVGK